MASPGPAETGRICPGVQRVDRFDQQVVQFPGLLLAALLAPPAQVGHERVAAQINNVVQMLQSIGN